MRGLEGACADVEEFMKSAGQDVETLPQMPSKALSDLREALLGEEWSELTREMIAVSSGSKDAHLGKVGKEMADVIVVIIGTAHAYGIPLADIWDAVAISNRSKFDPNTGRPYDISATGKVLKGPNFIPAEQIIEDIMELKEAGD